MCVCAVTFMGASVCSVCFVCVVECVFMCCMKWRRQALVCTEKGWLYREKMSSGFPRTMFTFYCSGPLSEALGGRLVNENDGNVYIIYAAGKSKHQEWVIVARPHLNGVKQQC